jgi:two-component system phosphate regulon response regulator OmpR
LIPPTTHVLVVDDEQRIRELIVRWLRSPEYRVTTIETAEGGLAAVEEERPDLVIADKLLPLHSGLWLLKELRQRDETVPVILISGAEFTPDERHELETLGKAVYLQKPFSRAELDSAIGGLMEGRAFSD